MVSPNGLICFTNCLLPLEDGGLVEKDLWIDERRGVILNAQKTFFLRKERPEKIIDLAGNILSPGFLDIQINGAYGFDFSIYEGDDQVYKDGLKHVAEKIVESGVTSLVPTIVTQEKSLYPKLLYLLRPYSPPSSANILGWHAEGPYLQLAKRGAHAPPFLLTAPEGYKSIEKLYGAHNLADGEDWLMDQGLGEGEGVVGVRMLTAAPEVEGVMESIGELTKRGIVFSIGHSIATIDIATTAVQNGAKLITHLFNAMPQLHHRDPSIIGLLGASPYLSSPLSGHLPSYSRSGVSGPALNKAISTLRPAHHMPHKSEAFDDLETPPLTPVFVSGAGSPPQTASRGELHLDKGQVADLSFERPFYEMIVDGIHSHPNSVRVSSTFSHR
jgi:N-acetylglucosamine-6-phosphate deacetylase